MIQPLLFLVMAPSVRATNPDPADPAAPTATDATSVPAPGDAPDASPAPAAGFTLDAGQGTRSKRRKRFIRGSVLATAGSVALPTGALLVLEGVAAMGWGAPPDHAYADEMTAAGTILFVAGYPLLFTGTHMQRRALEDAGCQARPTALRYVAPAMLAGSAAALSAELWSVAPAATGWLATGAWGVGSAEALLLMGQAAHCPRLRADVRPAAVAR
jgi:hypothetical protein